MRRALLLCLLLTGCHLDELLRPTAPPAPKKCYWKAYSTRSVTVSAGDSTWTVRDTVWLGSVNIECPKGGK